MADTSSIVFRDIENVLRRARTDVSKALRAYHRTASHASLTTPASASGASSASNASGGVSGGREDTAARQTAARRDASPSPATSFSASIGQGGTHSNPSITGGQRATSVVDFVAIFAEHNLISDQCLSASRDTVAAALSNGRTGTNSGYWQPPVRPLSASDRLSASGPIFQQQKPASASTEQRSGSAISETVSSTAHCPAGQANTSPAEGPLASGSGRGGGTGGGKPVVVSYGGHRGTDYWVSNSGLSRSVAASSDTSGKVGVTQSSSSTVSNVDRPVGYHHQQRSASLGRLSSDRANNVVEPPFFPQQQQQQQAKQGTPSLLSSATRQQLAAKHSLGNADNRRKQDWFENRRQSLEHLNGIEAASSLNSSGSRAWSVGSSQSQRANSCLNVNTTISSAVHQHQQPEAPVQPAVRWPTQSTTGVVVGQETAAIGPTGPAFSCLDNMSSSRVAAINSKKLGAGGNARGNGRVATATAETDRSATVTSCPQQRPFLGDTVLQKSAFRPVQTRNKSATNGAPSDVQSQGQGQGRFSVTSMSSLQQQTSAVASGMAPAPQQRGRAEGRSAGPVVGRHSLALDKPLPLAASLSPWTLQAADRTEELNDIANGIMPVSIASTGRPDASKSSVIALASEFQRRASADPAYNRTVFDLSLSPRATNAATLAVKREGSERLLGEKRRLKTRRQRSLERNKALSTRLSSNNSVDILNLAGAMMARRNSSDDSSDDSGAEKRLSLKKAPPEQKDTAAVDAFASTTMASVTSIKSTPRRKQQPKNGNRNSIDLKSSSLGDTENVNLKSLSPRLQQQIQQQQQQLLLDHSVDSSPSLDDSLQEVLGDLLPANELLLAASHSYDARSSATHLTSHEGVKMIDSSVSPVFNAIPVTMATYPTQSPSLPVVQLNVLQSTDHHQQLQIPQVRLINSATSPPMIKVIEPGMVSNLPQQHSQPKQPVVNSSTKMLQVDNYGPLSSAASASPSSSPVSYVSHFATVPRYYKEYSLPAPSSASSQQQQLIVASHTESVLHHYQPGNDGSKHYPEQLLSPNESHPSAGSSVSQQSAVPSPQLRTAALELWDASVNQQQQSTANTRDALMLVPAGGQRSRRESMVSSSTQTDVPDFTSIPTDDKSARNVAAKAAVATGSVALVAENQCVALSPVPVTTLSAASRTDDTEVAEACQWLRAAGFPQYARMYEDSLTPINLEEAAIDHHFLASQQLDCLISRLRVLNRASKPLTVKTKNVQGQSSAVGGGEEEEPSLALSSQWKYEPATRHWTRSPSTSPTTDHGPNVPLGDGGKLNNNHIHSHHYSDARQMSVSPLADDVFIATKSPSTSFATRGSHNAFPSVAAVNGHLAKPKVDNERTQGLVSPDTVHHSNSRTVNGHGHGSVAKNGSENNMMPNGTHLTDKRQMTTAVSADQLSDVNAVVLRNQYFDAAKDTRTQPHKQGQDAQLLDLFDDDMLLLMGEKPRPKLHTYDAKTLPNRKSNTPKRDSNGHGVSMTSLALQSSGSIRQGTDLLLGIQPKTDNIGIDTARRNSSEAASSTVTVSAADVMTASSSSVSSNQTPQPISSDAGGDMHKRTFAVNASNRQSVYDNFSSKVSSGGAQHELDVILQQLLESASSLHIDNDDGAPNAGSHGNSSLNTGTRVFGLHPIPIDIDLIADERGTAGELTDNKQNMDVQSLQGPSPCKGGLQVNVVDDIILSSSKVKDAAHDESSKDEASPSSDSGLPSSCSQNSSCAVTGNDERLSRDIDSSLERSDDTCDIFAECNLSDNTLLTESNNTINEDAQRNAHGVPLASLSAGQLVLARQLCLLQLTSLLEHRDHTLSVSALPTSNPAKAKMSASARVFGVTLDSVERTTGQSLLPCISTLMNHLHTVRTEAVGLFRRPGVHSQVLELKQQLEKCSDVNLHRYQPYDVADVLRHFYRDLSECLMTDRISAICISLYRNLPASEHLATLRMALVLLPDAHLASLRQLLFLLRSIAQQSSVNQMTTVNLAICFAPSIFRLWEPASDDPSIRTGMPTDRQLKEQQAAQQCLVDMINCTDDALFVVPHDVMSDINKNASVAVLPKQVSSTRLQEILSFAEDLLQSFVGDMKTQYSWTSVFTVNGIEVAYRQLTDVCIPMWRVTAAEIEAPPSEVLSRIVADRGLWEEGYVQGRVLFKVDQQTDVFQHSTRVLPVLYGHDVVCSFCELRSWRTGLANGACALVCTSVVYGSGGQSQGHAGDRQGNVLASHYFIQPCGAGKSSLIQLAQIDFGGLSPMWYKRCYSQVCAQRVRRICEQFQRRDEFGDVPETPL